MYAAQAIIAVDIDGSSGIIPLVPRVVVTRLIRLLLDAALFEFGLNQRHLLYVLTNTRIPTIALRFELISLNVVNFTFSAFVSVAEILFVPPEGRDGCIFVPASIVYHIGTAVIEMVFMIYTLYIVFAAKARIVEKIDKAKRDGSQNSWRASPSTASLELLTRSKEAVDTITRQTFVIFALFCLIFAYTAIVVALRQGVRFLCQQPVCTPGEYPLAHMWIIAYQVGDWVCVGCLSVKNSQEIEKIPMAELRSLSSSAGLTLGLSASITETKEPVLHLKEQISLHQHDGI